MSTDTTEISSNSNSPCRLLDCLNSLPFHDQRAFRSLLGHIELVRLSACCRSLTSSVRNDRALWQALYHRDFLSKAYYAKEMDFVLWCIRTDVNNPCTSDKRADLLENVDWYNTYRRRVSTENNWRYGRCNTTHIDMEHDNDGVHYCTYSFNNRIFIEQQSRLGETSYYSYILEYLPHSNLKSSSNIEYNSTPSTSPNIILPDTGNDEHSYSWGDHYITAYPRLINRDTNYNVKILSRKQGDVFATFDIPARYHVDTIEGKWILLVRESLNLFHHTLYIYEIMVFDIDNSTMCPGNIGNTWNATRFYKTTNDTAIVYTAKLVDDDDDVGRIEWALYEFSSNNPVVQLRNGWFYLPEELANMKIYAYNSYDSHMIIELDYSSSSYSPYIMHSVASSGQSHTPRNCFPMTGRHILIPLLRAGCRYLGIAYKQRKIWTDLSYNDDQVLRIPGTASIDNVIGDLYVFDVTDHDDIGSRWLVDINTKEVIRELKGPNIGGHLKIDTMFGMLCSPYDSHVHIVQEYGEL